MFWLGVFVVAACLFVLNDPTKANACFCREYKQVKNCVLLTSYPSFNTFPHNGPMKKICLHLLLKIIFINYLRILYTVLILRSPCQLLPDPYAHNFVFSFFIVENPFSLIHVVQLCLSMALPLWCGQPTTKTKLIFPLPAAIKCQLILS